MRGERYVGREISFPVGGSSPHARGTLSSDPSEFAFYRFIPACAGNAQVKRHVAACPSVHPRMRGERVTMARGGVRWLGSSPHARGTLPRRPPCLPATRFIPACAGNAYFISCLFSVASGHPRMRGKRSSSRALFHNMIHKIKEPTD